MTANFQLTNRSKMQQEVKLSLRTDVDLFEISPYSVILQTASNRLTLDRLSPGLLSAILTLGADGATEEQLTSQILQSDDFSVLPKFYYFLERFVSLGLICYTISVDGSPLATVIPLAPAYKFKLQQVDPETPYLLSRFAYCHREARQLFLECPLSHAKLLLADWRSGAIFSELANPLNSIELADRITGLSTEMVQLLLSILLTVRAIDPVQEDKITESDAIRQWEFHDLLYHARTRKGRHLNPVGKTYHFLDQLAPLPAVKPPMSQDCIPLYKPDLEKLQADDLPFSQVLEGRKSIRTHGEHPIGDRQLGEFLYRCARVKQVFPKDKRECSNRPYPGGGACYELELYLAVHTCDNLPSGFYHYGPQLHQLEKISEMSDRVQMLLKYAQLCAQQPAYPQVLIVIAARFARVSWLYQSMAYNAILKHVGVLYQTMYLVATAMQLAPSALGAGDADLFAEVAGTDYYAESSVGEFILGTR